jgi:hypothetical protein
VTELLQSYSQDLSNEDLIEMEEQGIVEEDEDEQEVAMETAPLPAFTIQRLVEAFRNIKSAMEIFETDDPNFERSSKVLEAMKNTYACYREIYHEKKKASSVQTSLDSCFKKPQPMQKSPQQATVSTEPHKYQLILPIRISAIDKCFRIVMCLRIFKFILYAELLY